MKRSVLALSVLLAAGLLSACSPSAASTTAADATAAPALVDVATVTVTEGPIESTLEISGTLTPRTRVAVMPRVPGSLERVLVDLGDAVTAGQVIATLDHREFDAQVDAATAAIAVAKAAVETAEATLANALLERDRSQSLFDQGALPRQRLETAQTAHRAATAQRDLAAATMAQAEASARRARETQRDTTITSPITGVIVERNYDAGAMPSDKPIVVVADLRQMKLEAGVSEMDAGRLHTGMKARVEVQAKPGQTFDGELANIAPEVDERNRHFRIELRLPNDKRELLSGMYATARIVERQQATALLVPRDAIATRDGARIALRVQGDTVQPVTITEGLSDGTRVQVVSGLAAGDVLVSDARRQFTAGTKVRPVPVR